MTDTPIAAAVERELAHHGLAGLADVGGTIKHLIERGIIRDHTKGSHAMGLFADAKDDLDKFTDDLKTWTTTGYQDVVDFIENKAPKWSAALDNAAANPAIDELLNSTHLSPAYLVSLAGLIRQAEQDSANLTAAQPAPEPAR
jgi:hypothetical protein